MKKTAKPRRRLTPPFKMLSQEQTNAVILVFAGALSAIADPRVVRSSFLSVASENEIWHVISAVLPSALTNVDKFMEVMTSGTPAEGLRAPRRKACVHRKRIRHPRKATARKARR